MSMPREIQIFFRLVLIAAGAALLYFLFSWAGQILFPVFFSLILAYLLDPIVDRLQKRGIGRSAGILIILLGLLLFILMFMTFFYPVVHSQLTRLINRMPGLSVSLQTELLPWLKEKTGFVLPADISAAISQYGDDVKSALPALLKRAGEWILSALTTTGAIVSSLLNIVLIPVFTFYFLRDFDRMKLSVVPIFPPAQREFILSRLRAVDEVVGHWFRGQLQVASILAVLYATGFGLVFFFCGMDAMTGIVVGVLTGCLSVIPYVGAVTGSILSLLFALLDWHGILPIVLLASVFGLIQIVEGYVLTPRIVGEKLGLSPAVIMIALLAAGSIAGLPGMLFALPITGALKVLGGDLMEFYFRTDWYRQGAEPSLKKKISAKSRKR